MSSDVLFNAQWLYNRCSLSCTSMGMPLSALDLCLKILQVIRETDEDDDIQIPLMEAMKDARQRDVAFIFELCERACDLRDDTQLSEETLRAIAKSRPPLTPPKQIEHDDSNETINFDAMLCERACDTRDDTQLSEEQSPHEQVEHDDSNETINFDAMQVYQLRTRVLGLNMPTFSNLWKYLQEAGWTYSSGVYHIPKGEMPTTKGKKNTSAKTAFMLMDFDNDSTLPDEGEQDEEGPEEFMSPNDLVDYLDEYCMPDYRATSAEIQEQQKILVNKSKAYQRRNKRLRWELLEVAYRDHLKQCGERNATNNIADYGHNNRTCEICFRDSHPNAPKVACRECRLVVHTKCYGILDYEDTTDNSNMKRVDKKGLFTCDVCDSSEGKITDKKKANRRWRASQSSGHRIHHHPAAVCSICQSKNIAGGMIKIEGKTEETKRKTRGSSPEQWVHLVCLNAAVRHACEPSEIRSNTKVALKLRRKLESCKEKEVCVSCTKRKGVILKCRGQCGNHFHCLCIQIERRNDISYNYGDHFCLNCSNLEETNSSQVEDKIDTDKNGTTTDETDQYFDKRSKKRKLMTAESEYAIAIPAIKTCVAQAQNLVETDPIPAFDKNCYQNKFKEWSYLLSMKQSILLYGLGSKKEILSAFGEALSNEGDVLNINGYDDDIDLNQLFDHIDQLFLDGRLSAPIASALRDSNDDLITKAVNIAKKFASIRSRPLFILINTIDGVGLSDDISQRSLQALTQSSENGSCPMVRIAASVDNINAGASLWSPQVEHKFDWAWKMVNTHQPFLCELQDGPQLTVVKKKQKTTSTLKTGVAVLQVLSSLAPKHTEVLQLLVAIQRENANNVAPYSALKEVSLQNMITNSEGNLRNILVHLSDHDIVKSEKDGDGNECWYVPSTLPLDDIINFKRST